MREEGRCKSGEDEMRKEGEEERCKRWGRGKRQSKRILFMSTRARKETDAMWF